MIWAKNLLSCTDSPFCLHSRWRYNVYVSVCGLFYRAAHRAPLLIFSLPSVWAQAPFLPGTVMPLFPRPCKALLTPKQTPVPELGFHHLFCPSLENAIKPAWQLCQHKGQRGLHGRKLCKIHSSSGCVKNILARRSSNSKWSIVSSASFSLHYFVLLMDLC